MGVARKEVGDTKKERDACTGRKEGRRKTKQMKGGEDSAMQQPAKYRLHALVCTISRGAERRKDGEDATERT